MKPFSIKTLFSQDLKQKVDQTIESTISLQTSAPQQQEFVQRFDNFIELEKLTQRTFFENQIRKSYLNFINKYIQQGRETNMIDLTKEISHFGQDIASNLAEVI